MKRHFNLTGRRRPQPAHIILAAGRSSMKLTVNLQRPSLFDPHSAQLYDLGVLVRLGSDECRELRRGIADHLRALLGEALANDGIAQGLDRSLMQFLANVPGNGRRGKEAKPVRDIEVCEILTEFGKGYSIRQYRGAF